MSNDDVTALVKIVSHCGISLNEVIYLKKKDIDLEQKTILFKQRGKLNNKLRKTTIRPDDVSWFRVWLQDLPDRLFPFSSRSIYYQIHKIVDSPHALRKALYDEMRDMGAKDGLVAIKMGYFVDDKDEENDLFVELQAWEEKHFGGKI